MSPNSRRFWASAIFSRVFNSGLLSLALSGRVGWFAKMPKWIALIMSPPFAGHRRPSWTWAFFHAARWARSADALLHMLG